MVDNLLGDVDAEEISRINVIFHIEDRNMDSLIGRTAHIKYLSDLKFIKMFFIVFEKFFIWLSIFHLFVLNVFIIKGIFMDINFLMKFSILLNLR